MAREKLHKIEDMATIGIIAIYLVQMLRKPTFDEIREAIKTKLRVSIPKQKLRRALEGAKKGNFITSGFGQDDDEVARKEYAMRTLGWSRPPEIAVWEVIGPVLTTSEEGKAIQKWFDDLEGIGLKKRGGAKNFYRNRHLFIVQVITTDILVGSQPGSGEVWAKIRQAHPTRIESMGATDEIVGFFDRDFLTGEYIIGSDVLQGWFGANVAKYNDLPPYIGHEVAFKPIRFTPDKPVLQGVLPVTPQKNKGGKSTQPQFYEVIQPGQLLTLEFIFPTTGIMTVEQLEASILRAGLRPVRGISPSRGRRYGRFIVTSFEDLGAIEDVILDCFKNDVPSTILEEHGEYFLKAIDRLRNVGKPSPMSTEDPGPMPTGGNGSGAEADTE